ncbi:MAG: VacJ family lipoprotein [Pseudomonadota bacterium]
MKHQNLYPVANRCRLVVLLIMLAGLGGCVSAGSNPDPLENFNRSIHNFNDSADRRVLKPLAQGYRALTPDPLERGIRNVFSNLDDPQVFLNQLLQGKPGLALSDLGRFLVNSTVGIGGLFDVASTMGLEKHQEDFGQTFARWGFGRGAYLVIPFWGPSNPRDGIGDILGSYTFPPRYLDDVPTRNVIYGLSVINRRANLLDAENIVSGDRYIFFREAYLQRREFLINDGEVEDDFLDDDF